jgi:TonB family protein
MLARASGPVRAVSDGGFGSASAGTPASPQPPQQTARAAFGDTTMAKAHVPNARPAVRQASGFTPVEITFKPRPAYTEEARRAQIEGEVLVETVFTASGDVQIVRIIRGLPHGLNEMALAAVQAIRFHPATRYGEPVDSTANVRMNFELAY